jgi:putative DNA primase/helicase
MSKHKARLTQIGVGTLAMIAKEHGFNPKEAYRNKRWAGRIRFADITKSSSQEEDDSEGDGNEVELPTDRIMRALNDQQVGDALLYCDIRSGQRIYNINAKLWMIYDKGIWRRDMGRATTHDISTILKGSYRALAKAIRDHIQKDPIKKDDPRLDQLAEIQRRLKDLGKTIYLAGVKTLAERHMHAPATTFNSNPEILVVENGTLDFKEGVFREHRPSDYVTVRSSIIFDSEAECPHWDAFLDRIVPDVETQQYLARAVGYSLTGLVNHDVLFFAFGTGANGKSTFFSVLELLLGELMTTLPVSVLLSSKQDGNVDYHKATMEGKRVVLADEVPERGALKESLVKSITGGDAINARRPYEIPYVFRPTHKLWLMGNHKPEIKGTDEGIWRRIHAIPFLVSIAEKERRPRHELLAEFSAELPGILNWAICGLIESREIGLCPPPLVVEAVREYREESDQFGTFLIECVEEDVLNKLLVRDLAQSYKVWCEQNNEYPRYSSTRKIARVMEERGYSIEIDRTKCPVIIGLKLKTKPI